MGTKGPAEPDRATRELRSFVALVGSMRAAQRAYYRGRRKANPADQHRLLQEALGREALVDAAILRIAEGLDRPLFAAIGEGGEEGP